MARFFVLLDSADNVAHATTSLQAAREYMREAMGEGDPLFPAEVDAVFSSGRKNRFDVLDLDVTEPFEPAHALATPPVGRVRWEGGARLDDSTREGAMAECARRNLARLAGHVESGPQWSVVVEIGEPAPHYGLAEWELTGLEGVQTVQVFCPLRVVVPTADEIERLAQVAAAVEV